METKYIWLVSQLEELIKKNIKNGISKLPTEHELCRHYQVSRQTVRQALSVLKKNGMIESTQGSGTFITGILSETSQNTIALLIPNEHDYLYPTTIEDIRTQLTKQGYSLDVFFTNYRLQTEREHLKHIISQSYRGLIVQTFRNTLPNHNTPLYDQLYHKGCEIIFLGRPYIGLTDHLYITEQNLSGGTILTDHLIALGHTRISTIFNQDSINGHKRFFGYIAAMQNSNLEIEDDLTHWYHTEEWLSLLHQKNAGFIQKAIQKSIGSCTAFLCQNNMIAYYVARELSRAGFQIPEDITIATYDDSYLKNIAWPSIYTLSTAPHQFGLTAANMMIDRLRGLPVESRLLDWLPISR